MKRSTSLRLERLKIRIPSIQPKDNFLEYQNDLKQLDLSENNLGWLHKSTFQNKPNLEVLILANNQFSQLPNYVNSSKSLKYLDISGNKFKYLKNIELPNLRGLKISDNPFKEVHDNSWDLPNLDEFVYSRETSSWKHLFGMINSLKVTSNLKNIYISNPCENRLSIYKDILQNLESFTVITTCLGEDLITPPEFKLNLNLKYLKILSISDEYSNHHFGNYSKLEVLLISSWKGSSSSFEHLSSLKYLHIGHSVLDEKPPQRNISFKNPNLVQLAISYTSIFRVYKEIFEGCSKLEKIGVTYCELNQLDKDAFSKNIYLEELDLSWNRIKALPPGLFDNLRNLKSLKLNGNPLQNLPGDIFKNQNSMLVLNLGELDLDSFNM